MLALIGYIVGLLGFAYGIRCYYELWKWAKQCQNTRIAIEYKGKVKTMQPIVEWLLWANTLDRSADAKGRVLYHMGGTRIAILKDFKQRFTFREMLGGIVRSAKPKRRTSVPGPKQGRWSSKDQTPQGNKVAA